MNEKKTDSDRPTSQTSMDEGQRTPTTTDSNSNRRCPYHGHETEVAPPNAQSADVTTHGRGRRRTCPALPFPPDQQREPPPDGGWGWMVVFGCAMVFFFSGGFGKSFTLVYQQLKDKFHRSATATAWVSATFGTVKMCSSPVASALCNKFNHRRVAIAGGVVTAVGMVMSAFPPNLEYLYVSYGLISAFGSTMITTPSFIIIGHYFSKKKAKAMSIAMTGASLGGIVCAPLIDLLFREYGYSGALLILGGLVLHYCVAGALYRPLRMRMKLVIAKDGTHEVTEKKEGTNGGDLDHILGPPCKDDHDAVEINVQPKINGQLTKEAKPSKENVPANVSAVNSNTDIEAGEQTQQETRRANFRKPLWKLPFLTLLNIGRHLGLGLLKDLNFLIFCLLMMGTFLCLGVSQVFLSGLTSELDISVSQLALILSVSSGADIPCRIVSGLILDLPKVRERRLLAFETIGVLAAVCACILPFSNSYPVIFIVWILFSAFGSVFHTQHATALSDLVGRSKFTSAIGVCRLFMGMGLIIGPTLGGYLKDQYGSYKYTFYFAGASMMVCSILSLAWHTVFVKPNPKEKKKTLPKADTPGQKAEDVK